MPLRIGLMGRGRFGKHYARLIPTLPDVVLSSVAEDAAGVPELLADPSVEAVVIATPTLTHEDLAVRALAAGKHVLLEKPMAASVAGAERIAEAARASGKTFMLGHQFLYNDHVRRIRDEVESGALGNVVFFASEQFAPGPVPAGVGCFLEMATHDLAILDYLCVPGELTSVSFVRAGTEPGREDAAAATLMFSSGLTASVATSWIAPEKVRRFTIIGTKSSRAYDDLRPPTADSVEPLQNELEHFLECLRSGREPLTNSAHGLKIMRWITACTNAFRP